MTFSFYNTLRRMMMVVMTVFIIGTTAACANTQTRIVQGVFALDGAFAVAQESALAVIQSGVLTDDQKGALRTMDHHMAERLKQLTDMAIAMDHGSTTANVTQDDVDSAQQELSLFKGVVSLLKPPGSTPTTNKE